MDDAENGLELTTDAGVEAFRALVDGGGLGRWSSDGEARLREIDVMLVARVGPQVRFSEGDSSATESAGEKNVCVVEGALVVEVITLGWW